MQLLPRNNSFGTTQEEQLAHLVPKGGVNQVGLDLEVDADEIGGVGVVGPYPADLGRCEKNILGLGAREEGIRGASIREVEVRDVAGDDGFVLAAQAAFDG